MAKAEEREFTMVVERWQMKPSPAGWHPLKEEKVVGRVTAKRIVVGKKGNFPKTFDRLTGRHIMRRGDGSMYRFSLKIEGKP